MARLEYAAWCEQVQDKLRGFRKAEADERSLSALYDRKLDPHTAAVKFMTVLHPCLLVMGED